MKQKYIWLALPTLILASNLVFAQTRLPEIPIDQYSAEQKAAAQEFEAARKKAPWGHLQC